MKKRITAALLLAAILCSLLAVSAAAATYATVVGGWLRLRSYPSYEGTIITSYKTGTVVTVLSNSKGWARVMTPDYRLGYMDQRYLLYEGHHPAPAPAPKPHYRTWTTVNRTAWVTSQNGKGVRLRNAPEVNKSNVMGLYPVGRTVKELKVSNDGWSYIHIDSKYGYMMSKFLTTGGVVPPVPTGKPPKPTEKPTGKPTGKPTAEPSEEGISGVQLNITNPKSGDTLKLTVKPSGAKYSVVWYQADTKVLLSTGKSYTVSDDDVGHAITVRVTGSDGTVAEVSTGKVTAGSGKKALSELPDTGFTAELPEETIPYTDSGFDADIPGAAGNEPEMTDSFTDSSSPSDPFYDDLPDFL